IIERLPEYLVDQLFSDVPPKVILKVSNLSGIALATEIDEVVIGIADVEKRVLVRDVLMLVAAGDQNGAIERIKLARGEIAEVDDLTDAEFMQVSDGDEVRQIRIGSPEHEEWLTRLARGASYFDWLLFMHPEQERVVQERL